MIVTLHILFNGNLDQYSQCTSSSNCEHRLSVCNTHMQPICVVESISESFYEDLLDWS